MGIFKKEKVEYSTKKISSTKSKPKIKNTKVIKNIEATFSYRDNWDRNVKLINEEIENIVKQRANEGAQPAEIDVHIKQFLNKIIGRGATNPNFRVR